MAGMLLAGIAMILFVCVTMLWVVGAVLLFGTTVVSFSDAFAGGPPKPGCEPVRRD